MRNISSFSDLLLGYEYGTKVHKTTKHSTLSAGHGNRRLETEY